MQPAHHESGFKFNKNNKTSNISQLLDYKCLTGGSRPVWKTVESSTHSREPRSRSLQCRQLQALLETNSAYLLTSTEYYRLKFELSILKQTIQLMWSIYGT